MVPEDWKSKSKELHAVRAFTLSLKWRRASEHVRQKVGYT